MFSPANLSTFPILAIARSQLQVYYVATILYIIVCMDYVNLTWLDPLLCKILLQQIWLEEGVAIRVWNYMLYHLPMFTTTIIICSFNCLIALEAKCRPSNDSNFIVLFMNCTLNIQMFTRITRPIKPVDPIQFSSLVIGHLSSLSH